MSNKKVNLSLLNTSRSVVVVCIMAVIMLMDKHLFFPQSAKSDLSALNHPAIKRFLESPSRSSSPLNQSSESTSVVPSESESLSQQAESGEKDSRGWKGEESESECRPGRNTGKVTGTQGIHASPALYWILHFNGF